MKKTIIPAIFIMASLAAAAQTGKFDAGSRAILDYYHQTLNPTAEIVERPSFMPEQFLMESRTSDPTVTVMVGIADGYTLADIEAIVDETLTSSATVAVVSLPISQLDALEASDAVKAISFGQKHKPMLNKAAQSIGVDKIHKGTGLPQGYDGTGVIAGLYDVGLDPNHPNFIDFDSDDKAPRIARLWYYGNQAGTATTYDTPAKIKSFTTDTYSEYHGTHTLGCLTGSFNQSGGTWADFNQLSGRATLKTTAMPFIGMAPKATPAVGCGQLFDANIMGSVGKILDYAESEGKPVVVSLSLGSVYGPHDGTDLLSQFIEENSTRGIICMAIGNDGESDLSISLDCTDDNSSVNTVVASDFPFDGQIEIWGSNSENFTVKPCVVDVTTGNVLYSFSVNAKSNMTQYVATSNYNYPTYHHNTNFDKAFSTSYWAITSSTNTGTNSRCSVSISYQMHYNGGTNSDRHLKFGLIVEGNPGQRIDIVNNSGQSSLSSCGIEGWTDGSAVFSASSMACAKGIVTVGAYNTRKTWGALDGNAYSWSGDGYGNGAIAPYSSYGTLVDGRTLPTVCAPGTGITSSTSSYYTNQLTTSELNTLSAKYTYGNRTYYWSTEQGTSMACPVLAGGIALWLQADPYLTVDDVIEIIGQTAVVDKDVTGTGNPVQWGYGKFNALDGLKAVLNRSGVGNITADRHNVLFTPTGTNTWEVFAAGEKAVEARIYNMSGALVDVIKTSGDTATLDCSKLAKGIYLVDINGGTLSSRIAVR